MQQQFDPGYGAEPFASLCSDYPGSDVFPAADFRVEWGPIFHRGRLDGSARVLVLGQDPAAHEAIVRRILVGEAGRRTQGFLAKLGITTSYVMVNTFLYSLYGNAGGNKHKHDAGIIAYRDRWLDALLVGSNGSNVEAVVALGSLADDAFTRWRSTAAGKGATLAYAHITHPTQPESSSGSNPQKLAAALKALLQNWNAALQQLRPQITHPDMAIPSTLYGDVFTADDLPPIPDADLPAGLPDWMGSLDGWAARTGATAADKRATITVTVPAAVRTWS